MPLFLTLLLLGILGSLSAAPDSASPPLNGLTQSATNAPPNIGTNSAVAPSLSTANATNAAPARPISAIATNPAPAYPVGAPTVAEIRPESPTFKAVNPELATVSPIASNARNPQALDLQTCFQLTAVRNDTLKITLQDILIARARLSQTIANLFPTFSVNNQQEFIHYNGPPDGGLNFSSSTLNNTISNKDRNYESASHVTLDYTLFNGGQNLNNLASNAATLEYRKLLLQRKYQTIYQSVAQAFYQVLQYQGDLSVQDDLANALQARVHELEDRVKIGRSRPSELLQSQVTLANTRVSIEQSKGALGQALETLAFYVGIESQHLVVKESTPFPSVNQLEAYLQRSGARPDLLAEYQNLRSFQRTLDSTRGQLLPTITAQGNFLASQDPNTNRVDATMILQASLPIFDGGLILSRINENKQLVKQEQLNVEELQRTTDQDVRTAYHNFNASVAQVLVLRQAAQLSAENFQGQLIDYRRGVVANLDVLTALQDFQNIRQQLHDADMSARINLINLHVASGIAATGPGATSTALPLNLTPPPQKAAKN